jgi:hypothetical protein
VTADESGARGARDTRGLVASYPVGYTPSTDGTEYGHWTIRVKGGPAFAQNAAMACRIAERHGHAGADLLRRLAEAIDEAHHA